MLESTSLDVLSLYGVWRSAGRRFENIDYQVDKWMLLAVLGVNELILVASRGTERRNTLSLSLSLSHQVSVSLTYPFPYLLIYVRLSVLSPLEE